MIYHNENDGYHKQHRENPLSLAKNMNVTRCCDIWFQWTAYIGIGENLGANLNEKWNPNRISVFVCVFWVEAKKLQLCCGHNCIGSYTLTSSLHCD